MLARGEVVLDDVGDEVACAPSGRFGVRLVRRRAPSARSIRARTRLAAQDREDLEQAEADRLAGHRHAQGVDDVAEPDSSRLRRRLAPDASSDGGVEVGRAGQLVPASRAAARRRRPACGCASRTPSRRTATRRRATKKSCVVEDVAGDLDPIARRLDDAAHELRASLADGGRGDPAGALAGTAAPCASFSSSGSCLHVALLEGDQLLGVEAGRRLVHPLQREVLDHLLAREDLGLVVERPAEQQQVVDDRVGQVADLLVEVDDHRVERLGRDLRARSLRRSPRPCS